ncbi:MAG: TolC family protein [Acidobacteriaceae bacterium]
MNFRELQTTALMSLVLLGTLPQGIAQQVSTSAQGSSATVDQTTGQAPDTGATPAPGAVQSPTAPAPPQTAQQAAQAASPNALPTAPEVVLTQPLFLRSTSRDYAHERGYFPNPFSPYLPTTVARPRLGNTPRLEDLLKDGKIYLSLDDAVMLALENNFDIAIARYNLDIADTDLLRAKAGSGVLGVQTGLVTGTLGGQSSTITGGGGPGGTTAGSGGAGAGAGGLVLSENGAGPLPEVLDPVLTGTIQLERATSPQMFTFFSGPVVNQNTDQYNFGYNQGFLTGTALTVAYNNQRVTSSNPSTPFNALLLASFQAKLTQHLLQGFGWGVNGRFIVQAKNDRRITDSAFRQQLLYTINQVENIYWALVSGYEDEQAKERALAQTKQLAADNRKQLQIGTLAPLDVVNADSQVAADQQALIVSQTNLEYQQLIMKQAIARNLEDPTLSTAPVVPTDRVSLTEVPEETMSVEDLVKQAEANNPQVEQALLTIKNDEITRKALRNGLLPTVDAFAFYGSSALGGQQTAGCTDPANVFMYQHCLPTAGAGTVFSHLFNSSGPDKGAGFNINITLRNRVAQAAQARAELEYRQEEMRLQQLYTQIRIQIINQQYALTNDRAQVQAAIALRTFDAQSLEAEQKKFKLGASTTALVLAQQRALAIAENGVISATAAYAKDRAALFQILANTLDRYGISLVEATNGTMAQTPTIPGLEAPKPEPKPGPVGSAPPTVN